MNATEAKTILAAHSAKINAAFALRDACEEMSAWMAAGAAISALCAARDAEVVALAAMSWPSETEKEMTLYGRLLRRHTDPCSPTYTDLR
jgi:hypothetical protein